MASVQLNETKKDCVLVRGEWSSGLRRCNQNRKVASSNPLGARPGLGTQPRCEAPGDPGVEYVKNTVINIG